ncbi:ribose-phosphate pyrophosphokinase [Thermaurantiacus sp.]
MALFPVDELEALLVLRARAGRPISYGEVFAWFGLPFRRFDVGQLSAALAEVDARQRGLGRPGLAVLVVRQSDGLPGQGWWLSKNEEGWQGPIEGPEAKRFVATIQARVIDWWRERE